MIHLGIVASAHKFGISNPTVTLNETDSSSGHNGDTSISWTGIDFGTAETGRLVCVMVTGGLQQTTTDTVTNYMAVTIGGQTATLLVGHNEALYRAIWAVQLDTGTSGTVTITLSGGKTLGGQQQITSFSVYDADISNIATAEDLSKRGTFNTTANFSLSPYTDDGAAIVYGVSGTDIQTFPSWSFTNATELADFRGGTSAHSVGFAKLENTSTSETVSNTCADSVVDRPGAIAVSFLVGEPPAPPPSAVATYIGQDDFTTNNTASGTHTRTFDFTTTIDTEATYVAVVHGQSSSNDYHDINSVTIGGSSATSVVKSGGASSYTGQLARYTCSMWSVTGLSSGSSIQVAGVFDNGVGGDVFRSACQLYKITGGTVSVIDIDESGATNAFTNSVALDRSATEVVIIGSLANNTNATLSTTNGLVEDSDFVTESFLNVLSGRASGSSNTGNGRLFYVNSAPSMQATRMIGATFGVS